MQYVKIGAIVVLVQLVLATGYLFGAEKIGLIKNKQLGPENAKTEQLHEHDANGSDGH